MATCALSTTCSRIPEPLFFSPKMFSLETITPSKLMFAEFLESTILVFVMVTPVDCGSIKNKVIPERSPSFPPVLAATIKRLAL